MISLLSWRPIPTDKDGFGDYEKIPQPSLLLYRDGTYSLYDIHDDGELAGDIERHPDRYVYARLSNYMPCEAETFIKQTKKN